MLLTVCSTWPSSSCERGALCAIREDGRLSGSVSGGLIEDELIDLVRSGIYWGRAPRLLCYTGEDNPEQRRLPAGAQLTFTLEPAPDPADLGVAVDALRARRIVARELDLDTGTVRFESLDVSSAGSVAADGRIVRTVLRPAWRVWPLGAEATVQAIRRVARYVHFDVVSVHSNGHDALPASQQARGAPVGAIAANDLDALTIVLALDDAQLLLNDGLLDAIARSGSPLCVQVREAPMLAAQRRSPGATKRFVSGARAPEEVAVTALAALIELRAARLAGRDTPDGRGMMRQVLEEMIFE